MLALGCARGNISRDGRHGRNVAERGAALALPYARRHYARSGCCRPWARAAPAYGTRPPLAQRFLDVTRADHSLLQLCNLVSFPAISETVKGP
jgi:hypothetical protein